MFYELSHPISSDYYKIESDNNFNFPAHLHLCFEFITVTEGCMRLEVDNREYYVHAGEALLCFPNQVHSMQTPSRSSHILCLFSPDLVSAYTEKISAKIPENNLFSPPQFYIERMKSISNNGNIFDIKGLLYSICGCFDSTATYKDSSNGSNVLMHKIFRFVEDNYSKECSLSDLSRYTGYDYAYISRYFKKIVGLSYNDYVNQYRISKVCYLLQNSETTILDASNDCGFNSLRSLNRNFKEYLGITPTEYRKRIQENNLDFIPEPLFENSETVYQK